MASSDSLYIDVATLAPMLGFASDDNSARSRLSNICERASRFIDENRGTRFYTPDDDEIRYYTPHYPMRPDVIWIDDMTNVTEVACRNSDGSYTAWATEDWVAEPFTLPYTMILVSVFGSQSAFPNCPRAVRVQGRFGYSDAPPAVIQEAALLIALRMFERPRVRMGGAGKTAVASTTVVNSFDDDPDIMALLKKIPKRQLPVV